MSQHVVLTVEIEDKLGHLVDASPLNLKDLTRNLQLLLEDGVLTIEGEPTIVVKVTAASRID